MKLFQFCVASLTVFYLAPYASGQGTFGQGRNLGGSISPGQRTLTGTPGDRLAREQQDAGQVSGSERFLRQNRQVGQFIGSDTADINNFFSQSGVQGSAAGLNNRNTNANRNRPNRGPTGRTQRRSFQPQLRVAFEYKPVVPAELSAQLDRRFSQALMGRRFGEVEVTVVGRTAVLTGVVPTATDRVLAQRLVSLEAGISAVQNDLTVVPWQLEETD